MLSPGPVSGMQDLQYSSAPYDDDRFHARAHGRCPGLVAEAVAGIRVRFREDGTMHANRH